MLLKSLTLTWRQDLELRATEAEVVGLTLGCWTQTLVPVVNSRGAEARTSLG